MRTSHKLLAVVMWIGSAHGLTRVATNGNDGFAPQELATWMVDRASGQLEHEENEKRFD